MKKETYLLLLCAVCAISLMVGCIPPVQALVSDADTNTSVNPPAPSLQSTVCTPCPTVTVRPLRTELEVMKCDALVPRYYTAKDGCYAFTDANGQIQIRVYGKLTVSDGENVLVSKTGFVRVDENMQPLDNDTVDPWSEEFGEAELVEASDVPDGYVQTAPSVYVFTSAGGLKHYRASASVGGRLGFYPCDENGNVQKGALEADAQEDIRLIASFGQKVFVGDAGYVTVSKPESSSLINMNNRLDPSYIPENMVSAAKYLDQAPFTLRDNSTYANAEAMEAFVEMANAAYNEKGFDSFYLCNVYRSYETQQELWDYRVSRNAAYGTDPFSPIGSAYPGSSEHQSGFAFDIGTVKYKVLGPYLANTAEHKWLAENSWRFGFILRYQKEKQYITGIKYEPYHFRYVGKELAEYLYKENMCLEEYYDAPVVWYDVDGEQNG